MIASFLSHRMAFGLGLVLAVLVSLAVQGLSFAELGVAIWLHILADAGGWGCWWQQIWQRPGYAHLSRTVVPLVGPDQLADRRLVPGDADATS